MPPVSFDKESAYILHSRPYQDNSRVVEFLTLNHGRVAAFCKLSVEIPGKSLQPFTPLLITCGVGENLRPLRMLEIREKCCLREPKLLLLGLYVNELVSKLVPQDTNVSELFHLYAQALKDLAEADQHEKVLRIFELALLRIIGCGPQLREDVVTHRQVEPNGQYGYKPGGGPVRLDGGNSDGKLVCQGKTLLAMHDGFTECSDGILREARSLMRAIISYHLEGKELHTRGIFEYLKQQEPVE